MNTSETWAVLGLAPTEDTEQIREAYLAALPDYNPEDDPAGFMKLRAAYDAALAEARGEAAAGDGADGLSAGAADAGADDPDRVMITEILNDFPRRMKDDEWEKLFLAADVQSIDRQDAFSEKLLVELMEGQYLPRRIWLLFDRTFSWSARMKQLKELFPSAYIDYVMNGMRYDRAVRDDFFDYEKDGGEDFDAFVKAYHILAETIREGEQEKASELIAENQGSLFEHPDYRLLIARLNRMHEDFEAERDIVEKLDAAWPGDPFIRTAAGDILLADEPEAALDVYLEVLGAFPDHYSARIGAARARFGAGRLEEAKSDSYELLMTDPYDGNAMGVFGAANEALIPVFRERLDKDPADIEARYKLSSCHYNIGNFEESLDLIEDAEPDDKHLAKHYELYADLFVIMGKEEMDDEDKEILLEYIEAWEKVETDRQRLKFLPEKYHRLDMDDVALDKAEILLTEFPGEPELCRLRAHIFRERGDERRAFASIAEGLEKSPSHAALLSIEALLFEGSGNLGAAVDSANTALASFPFNLEMWELIGRTYERVDQYDEILKTVERATEFGLESDTLALLKAVALFETEDPEGEAQGLFEDAFKKDPDSAICLEKLAILYARGGRVSEAVELADRLLEKHEGPFAYLLHGWLFANFPQKGDRFSKARARADFRKAIELNDRYAPAWYQLGILAFDEGRMAEAAADFQLTVDIDPAFSDVHFYLALAYERSGDITSALRVLDEGMERACEKEDDDDKNRLLLRKADFLSEHHMYAELAALGDAPANAEKERDGIAERRGNLAYALYQCGKDDEAEAMFSRVFEGYGLNEAENASHMGRLKSCYAEFLRFAKHDIDAAIEFYNSANATYGTMRSMVTLAKIHRAAGDAAESKRLYKNALSRKGGVSSGKGRNKSEEGGDTACNDYLIGECYYGLGQYRKAKEYLKRAVFRAKEHEDCPKRRCFEALFTLALIALNDGDRQTALELYQEVLDTVPDRDYREYASLFE